MWSTPEDRAAAERNATKRTVLAPTRSFTEDDYGKRVRYIDGTEGFLAARFEQAPTLGTARFEPIGGGEPFHVRFEEVTFVG